MCVVKLWIKECVLPANDQLKFPEWDHWSVDEEPCSASLRFVMWSRNGSWTFREWEVLKNGRVYLPEQNVIYEGPWMGLSGGAGYGFPIARVDEIESTIGTYGSYGGNTATVRYIAERARKGLWSNPGQDYPWLDSNAKHLIDHIRKIQEDFDRGLKCVFNATEENKEEEFVEMDIVD